MNGRRHRGGVLALMLCSGLGTSGPAVAAPRLELVTRAGFPAPTPTAGVFPVAATPDGSFVVFSSDGPFIVPDQRDQSVGSADLFLLDRGTGEIRLITHAPGEATHAVGVGTGQHWQSVLISDDGRFVAFGSSSTELVPGQLDSYDSPDLFLFDRVTSEVSLVTRHAAVPQQALGEPFRLGGFTGDGSRLYFGSASGSLVPGMQKANSADDEDVYELHTVSGAIRLISHTAGDPSRTSNGWSAAGTPSADGEWLPISSTATDLSHGFTDANAAGDLFLLHVPSSTYTLVSRAAGAPAAASDRGGAWCSASADGRFQAFRSRSTNLLAAIAGNPQHDPIYLWDRESDDLTLVSHVDGAPLTISAGFLTGCKVARDGSRVLLSSSATDLVSGTHYDSNYTSTNLFLWSRSTNATQIVSRSPGDPTHALGLSSQTWLILSADGNRVLYTSVATTLVPAQVDEPWTEDVFLFDASSGSNRLVSHRRGQPTVAAGGSLHLTWNERALTADGDTVFFLSSSRVVAEGFTGGSLVFSVPSGSSVPLVTVPPRDATAAAGGGFAQMGEEGTPILVLSGASNLLTAPVLPADPALWNGGQLWLFPDPAGPPRLLTGRFGSATVASNGPATGLLSRSGAHVVIQTEASDLAAGVSDSNGRSDLYLYDVTSGETTLITRSALDAQRTADESSTVVDISDDGRFILYYSAASDLVPGQTGSPGWDLFLFDHHTGGSVLVTRHRDDPTHSVGSSSQLARLSPDASAVAFWGRASDIVDGSSSGDGLLIWERTTGTVTLASHRHGAPLESSWYPWNDPLAFSDDGRFLLYASTGQDLVPGQSPFPSASAGIFFYDRTTNSSQLVSGAGGSTSQPCNGSSVQAWLSGDGRYVVFLSNCTDVLEGSRVSTPGDVYLWDRNTLVVERVAHGWWVPLGRWSSSPAIESVSIARDGSAVVFSRLEPDLDDGTYVEQLLLWDRRSAITVPLTPPRRPPDPGRLLWLESRSLSRDATALVFSGDRTYGQPGHHDGFIDVLHGSFVERGRFHTVVPCRLFDSRRETVRLSEGEWIVPAAGACDIPATATSVAISVTLVSSGSAATAAVGAGNAAAPAATVCSVAGARARAGSAIVRLATNGVGTLSVAVRPSPAAADVIVDVTGYFD
jgi:Tol biopolymer transport system component